jgi:hypothetical protein
MRLLLVKNEESFLGGKPIDLRWFETSKLGGIVCAKIPFVHKQVAVATQARRDPTHKRWAVHTLTANCLASSRKECGFAAAVA